MRQLLLAALLVGACDSDVTDPASEDKLEISALVDIDDRGRILVTFHDTTTGRAGILESGNTTLLPKPTGGMVLLSVADMNENGRVVGSVARINGQQVPFIWEPGMPQLEVLATGDNHDYLPNAINDDGTFVGTVFLSGTDDLNPERLPFIWSEADGLRHLQPPIANGTFRWSGAYGINNIGQVVGFWDDNDNGGLYISSFSWMPGTGFDRVEGISGRFRGETVARAVNNNGEVTGLNTDSVSAGFVWNRLDGMLRIGSTSHSCGRDINDAGDVVGRMHHPGGNTLGAFYWNRTSGVTMMTDPTQSAYANRINNNGQAIGAIESNLPNGMRVTHFMWSKQSGMQIIGEIEYDWSAQANARPQSSQSLAC